jgi:hypothetical protein
MNHFDSRTNGHDTRANDCDRRDGARDCHANDRK